MYEYVYIIIVFLIIFIFAYVKLRYPFWNVQPAFHVYDFWRYWTKVPFYIQNSILIKTKFYDGKCVETIPYIDATDSKRQQIVDMIQCHYIDSDRVLTSIDVSGVNALMTGHSHPSYISIYNDTTYDILPDSSRNELFYLTGRRGRAIRNMKDFLEPGFPATYDILPDSSASIIPVKFPIACMLTYPVKFFILDSFSKMHERTVYYWDYICTHRDHRDVSRKLIQTNEYNCRIKNPDILGSIFKKEESLCEGIVPLVNYKTYTFYLRNVKIPRLPAHFTVERIHKGNMGTISDFMYGLTHPKSALGEEMGDAMFQAFLFPEMGAISGLILSDQLYVFALKRDDHVYGIYFFRNAHTIYDDVEDGNLLECVATVSNTKADGLFFSGFLSALRKILDLTSRKYKMMVLNDLGHNEKILEKWRWKYTPVFENKAAYYVYNMVCPGMPLDADGCFILT